MEGILAVWQIQEIRYEYVQRLCHIYSALTERIEHAGPNSKCAYFLYSSDDQVEQILGSHKRIPFSVRGQNVRIDHSMNQPYALPPGPSDVATERGTSVDPAASKAIIEELKKTVPKWTGTCAPSRVLRIGGLPLTISREALTNFWGRLGCVVEVHTRTFPLFLVSLDCVANMHAQQLVGGSRALNFRV
jgi:hypothetical protein